MSRSRSVTLAAEATINTTWYLTNFYRVQSSFLTLEATFSSCLRASEHFCLTAVEDFPWLTKSCPQKAHTQPSCCEATMLTTATSWDVNKITCCIFLYIKTNNYYHMCWDILLYGWFSIYIMVMTLLGDSHCNIMLPPSKHAHAAPLRVIVGLLWDIVDIYPLCWLYAVQPKCGIIYEFACGGLLNYCEMRGYTVVMNILLLDQYCKCWVFSSSLCFLMLWWFLFL